MFSNSILNWFDSFERDLPWRQTSDPYLIWVSEVILQQTRVAQGYDYYLKFIDRFPTVEALAQATEDEVLKYWQGLGYYSRARNLHTAAKSIQGEFPRKYKDVLALKGVGEYTAAAICSFAYGDPCAVVDGNVYRVLSRYFGVASPIDTAAGKREFAALAQELLNKKNPGRYNQAIMDFGAIQCKPKGADCTVCPLNESCIAYFEQNLEFYPVKKGVVKSRNRFFHYFFIDQGEFTYIRKRTKKDIWKNLYEFPLLETEQECTLEQLLQLKSNSELLKALKNPEFKLLKEGYKHILSHQNLYTNFYSLTVHEDFELSSSYLKIRKSDLSEYAIPRLIELLIEKYPHY